MTIQHRTRRSGQLVAVLSLGALALAACGSSTSSSTSSEAAASSAAPAASAPAASAAAPAASVAAAGACDPSKVVLIGQVRNETNPYEAAWLDGGDAYAKQVGLTQQRLTYGGESTKQQEQIRQVLATGDAACTVLNVLPNGDSDTLPIVKAAQDAGAWVVTQWNKPGDVNVPDYDHWISHLTYNGKESGKQIAEAMFAQMGGKGNIVALQGILDTAAAKDRFAGLQEALAANPGITLLDDQTADFSRDKALAVTKTLLTKHGDQINGIWTANDDMALGALQALDAAGKTGVAVAGIDAVPEAVQAVSDGKMTATVSSDGPWQGAIGLAIGYCAATGQLDVASLSPENRAFFAKQFLITKDNAADFLTPKADPADFDCANVFNRVVGPIQ